MSFIVGGFRMCHQHIKMVCSCFVWNCILYPSWLTAEQQSFNITIPVKTKITVNVEVFLGCYALSNDKGVADVLNCFIAVVP